MQLNSQPHSHTNTSLIDSTHTNTKCFTPTPTHSNHLTDTSQAITHNRHLSISRARAAILTTTRMRWRGSRRAWSTTVLEVSVPTLHLDTTTSHTTHTRATCVPLSASCVRCCCAHAKPIATLSSTTVIRLLLAFLPTSKVHQYCWAARHFLKVVEVCAVG